MTTPLADGSCAATSSSAVFRAFRPVSDVAIANHRHFTNRATYEAIVRQWWNGEGVVVCSDAVTHEVLSAAASAPTLGVGTTLPALSRLKNRRSAPNTFQANLTAAPIALSLSGNSSTEFWSDSGSVPGTLIDVYDGDNVRIRVDSKLAQPSTIHWHGWPVSATQDLNPMNPVAAGDGRYYKFTLTLGSADTYWYHPHARGVTAGQVHRGLAGAVIVRPRVDLVPLTVREQHIFLSELKLAADASIASNSQTDAMNGCEGRYVLVNGALRPTFDVRPGETQRWKLFNATSARYIRFALDDHAITLTGTDGGLLAAPVAGLTVLLIAPAQRAGIIVTTNVSGLSLSATSNLRALAYDRGTMGMLSTPTELILETMKISTDPAPPPLHCYCRCGRLTSCLPTLPRHRWSVVSC